MPTAEAQRTWTNVGSAYSTPVRRPQVEAAIEALTWRDYEAGMTLPFMPGESIKACVAELELPNVQRLAWDGALEFPGRPGRDGEYPGLYGIEVRYSNGRARVYVVDTGTSILPVASDFWPVEAAVNGGG